MKGLSKKFILISMITLIVGWAYFIYADTAMSEQPAPPAVHEAPAPAVEAPAPAPAPEVEAPKVEAPMAEAAAPAATTGSMGLTGKLGKVIKDTPVGIGKGQIDPNADKGYLGIPGAPKPTLIAGLLWAIWVGWIFSTVGAFGGIMAGVGHITIFGLADYAKSFKKTNVALNKFMTDTIRVSNQFLVGLSAGTSTVNYAKMGRLVAPLGIAMAVGAVGGSYLIPIITAGKISLKAYLGYFGLCVFAVAGFMYYGTTEAAAKGRKAAKEAAKRFEEAAKKGGEAAAGVKIVKFGIAQCVFTFHGVEFKFSPILAAIGGFFIASLASFLGIGGGFLLVPFMTDIIKLPMFICAGTSALIVLVGMIVSISTYMFVKGVMVWWPLIAAELVGIFIGSMIGPRTQKYIPDKWLKRLFVVLALYVGIRYSTKGFLGRSLVPPF